MKAIITKFHGPTDTKGSRYSASDEDGNRATVHADHALNPEQNHDAAALALCRKMKWSGTLVRGDLGTGYVYVWADAREQVEAPVV
jgi:hypothetical protein